MPDLEAVVTTSLGETAEVVSPPRLYKRRFYGLTSIFLSNAVLAWAWLSFAMVNDLAQARFGVDATAINWFSNVYSLAFAPFFVSGWFINRYGIKKSLLVAISGTVVGSWLRYGGVAISSYSLAMAGQGVLGVSQIFIVPLPMSYSKMWFSPDKRVLPTTIGSLATTIGSMLGSIATPYMTPTVDAFPRAILIVSIISTLTSVLAIFVPAEPPMPAVYNDQDSDSERLSRTEYIIILSKSLEFWLLATSFIISLGIFNTWSTLLFLYLTPYGFPATDVGLTAGLFTGVGVSVALFMAPFIDKWKLHIHAAKFTAFWMTAGYIIFIWIPETQSRAFAFTVGTLMGVFASIFVSVTLELLAELLYPVPEEFCATFVWCMGNLISVPITYGLNAGANPNGNPPGEMRVSLIVQAVLAVVLAALPVNLLGLFGRKEKTRFFRRECQMPATAV
jgi:MFS family permease